jgi:hypothetical protein
MSYTVREMLDTIAEYVDGSGVNIGVPAQRAQALRVYNNIVEELMYEDSWKGMRASLRFSASGGIFWTPPCVASIRSVAIDGRPAPVRPDSWQFLANGPGECTTGGPEIRDIGEGYATGVDLAVPMHLSAWSDSIEDVDAYVHFTDSCRGFASGNMPGFQQQEGERIHLVCGVGAPAQPAAVTRLKWTLGPKSINKPVTRGTVYVAGVIEGHQPVWLATLRPSDTSSDYRRYQLISGRGHLEDVHIVADCDLKFIRAVYDDEISLIQNPAAIRLAAQAFNFRDANNGDDYAKYKGYAISKLMKQLEQSQAGQTFRPAISSQRTGAAILSIPRSPMAGYPGRRNLGRNHPQ